MERNVKETKLALRKQIDEEITPKIEELKKKMKEVEEELIELEREIGYKRDTKKQEESKEIQDGNNKTPGLLVS